MKQAAALLGVIVVLVLAVFLLFRKPPAPADSDVKKLQALPYLTHSPHQADQQKSGVMLHKEGKTLDGYNYYLELNANARPAFGYVMDMKGEVLLTESASTNITLFDVTLPGGDYLKYIPDADCLGRFSREGKLLWKREDINIHHEVIASPKGTILTDFRRDQRYQGRDVAFDGIVELSADGQDVFRWWTFEHLQELKKHHPPSPLDELEQADPEEGFFDYYHQNAIQVLPDTPLGRKDKRFAAGNWLVSLRNVDLVIIMDRESKAVVWSYGPGEIQWQHMPRMLDNGNIILFDNGTRRKHSRVIEIEPISKKIVWEYKGSPPKSFFSHWVGSVQRLSNGNTLIGDGANGRAMEVTPAKEIVWEWYNPRIGKVGGRKVFYRMRRIPKKVIEEYLAASKAKP